MNVIPPARLVPDCQRLGTLPAESCADGLTFDRRGGLIPDGHERSMAGTSCAHGRRSGGWRET